MIAAVFENIAAMIVLTGALVGVAASLLGTFLVLRRASMLTDAISHSIVFGVVLVWLATRETSGPVQIAGAALAGLLTVFLTELLTASGRVKNDAAIGLVFPALFSAGVLLINLYAHNVHIDQHTVLLGEIGFVWLDTVPVAGLEIPRALLAMAVMTAINLAFVILFFKELKLTTFDPGLARALGFAPTLVFYALLALTSGTAVAAFDAVGAILFIAFVIVPPAAAYLLTDRLGVMLALGALIAVLSSVLGYALAVAWDVSIGGMMAVMTGMFFALAFLFGPRHGLLAQAIRRRGRREADDCRLLAIHLYNHQGEEAERNLVADLDGHLRWDGPRTRRIVLKGLDDGLIRRRGEVLVLTPKGRETALEILEPWRRGGV